MKKALSLLLTLAMLLTMVCIPAFAETGDPTEIRLYLQIRKYIFN